MSDDSEMIEAQKAVAKLDYELTTQDVAERLRFQGEFSQTAFKTLTLVNGGAIVALFTVIGNGTLRFVSASIWAAFVSFSAGLAFTLISVMCAFFAQAYFMKSGISLLWNKQAEMHGYAPNYSIQQKHEARVGNRWEVAAIVSIILGFVGFVAGSAFALSGVRI